MKLVAFCEAAADFRVASDLVDRVLREEGPAWVAPTLDDTPEAIRAWTVVDAAVLVWDMDNQPEERRAAVTRARSEAATRVVFAIVVGTPNAMREAWALAGFEPRDDAEAARLAELRRQLGFSPNQEAHLLDAVDEHAKRSAKRVLRALTLDDRDREHRCWSHTSLAILRERSAETYLQEFLDEVETHILPLVSR